MSTAPNILAVEGNAPALPEGGRILQAEEQFANVFTHSPIGMALVDLDGRLWRVNQALCLMLGYSEPELRARTLREITHPDDWENPVSTEPLAKSGGAVLQTERRYLHQRGAVVWGRSSASLVRDAAGQPRHRVIQIQDITLQKDHEREIARLSRLYTALSQINQAVVRMPTREELFRKVCQILVHSGGFKMAWVGWHDPATQQLLPVAECGDENGYLHTIAVYVDDRPEGSGPSGRCFRSGQPYICNDLYRDAATVPWRSELQRRGFQASAVFPIRLAGQMAGALSVYSDEPQFFQDREVALLSEAAGDIAFGIDNRQRDDDRLRAEETVLHERDFSEAMLNSLPGVLYLYDAEGRFLRWNKNFELVTGYTAAEIGVMRPLDFFAGPDRELVAARIAEVFEKGESSVEAGFVAKDGRITPYYFTGVVTRFYDRTCLVGVGIDISARKRAEEARLAIEARYHTLFEHAPDGIVIADAESVYLDANASMCRMLGYRRDELIGLHARDIVVQSEVAHIEPALDVIRARRDYHREWLFRRQDGSVFPAEVIATTMPDGNLMGMIRNITERKQAATRLAESERQYRELVELANSIILRWNSEGVITFLNDYGQRFFGYTAEEIHGRHVVGTLVPETDTNGRNMEPLMDQICANPEAFQDNTNENMRRNGERVWVAWTNRILRDANGRPVEILSVGADITRQHQAEVALRELNETLEHRVAERTAEMQEAVARAEAADRIKSAFLATMSHELRTPLNSIIGFTGILLQGLAGPLNPEQSKQLGMVRNSSRHLLELINDVLDISKIEANQLEMAALPFDLPESLARVVASIRPAAEKKGLELLVQVQPGLGRMTGDRRRVEQILLNLLNNAVKFTDHGKVTLTAEAVPDYHPATSAAAIPAVRLRVADTGLGIQPADLATLFQPFRQVDTGLARQHEGTGLGLAICRRLATLMGGEIFAVSEWSRGSEFTVILPLKRTHRP